MQTLLQSIALVAGSLVLALAGMALVRRSTRLSVLEAHREIAGFVYATIGVLYAVLVAFVCIAAWERFAEARHTIAREADAVTSLYQLAQGFSAPEQQQVQAMVARYAQEVTDSEWDQMARGQESPQAAQALENLWHEYAQLPQSDREQAGYRESLRQMSSLQEERGQRLEFASNVVPRVVWFVLIAGAVVTVAFTYLFGVRSAVAQSLITAAITLTVSGVLVLTFILDDPFRGDVRVTPNSFRSAQELMVKQSSQAQQGSAPANADPSASR